MDKIKVNKVTEFSGIFPNFPKVRFEVVSNVGCVSGWQTHEYRIFTRVAGVYRSYRVLTWSLDTECICEQLIGLLFNKLREEIKYSLDYE